MFEERSSRQNVTKENILLPTSRSPKKLYETYFLWIFMQKFGSETQKSDCTAKKLYTCLAICVQYIIVQYSAVQYSIVKYTAEQSDASKCCRVKRSTV